MIQKRLSNERGLSLVELAVYTAVFGIISTIMATMIVSLFRSEQTVTGLTESANNSQVAFRALTSDIERARQFDTNSHSVTASVAVGADGWECVRWSVADGNLLLQKRSDTSGSAWSGPAIVAGGVGSVAGLPFFSGEGHDDTGTLHYALSFRAATTAPIETRGQISTRMFAESQCLG